MRKVISVAMIALALGCSQKNPLLGEWVSNDTPLEMRVTFKPENKFDLIAQGKLGGEYRIVATGNYKYDGKSLTMQGESVSATVDGSPMPKPAMETFETGFKEEVGGPLTWKSESEFSYISEGNKLTYRRVRN